MASITIGLNTDTGQVIIQVSFNDDATEELCCSPHQALRIAADIVEIANSLIEGRAPAFPLTERGVRRRFH